MEKKKITGSLTSSLLGDVIVLICFLAITAVVVTGILHHHDEWGLYALLWVAAGESYITRLMVAKHNRQHDQADG